ncbi:acetylornithine aminotransferase [Talaromyces proteolyticus]|uniref:acetylornithine transaminase n=1 Tax=Talaromyces proteolyticus TaxID=1131652 RepID=A0AAD4L2Z9_9EURO|nr:acetylornithine aminotransferase [Talaromyces proteolyticus]KAH8705666.1 acetylornithine aminotransferase [Talaromyces proteolyticus]
MAMRAAAHRLHSVPKSRSVFTAHSFSTTARVSSLPKNEKARIQNESLLPTPDPGPDSSTAAFLKQRTPYMVPTYVRPMPMFVKGQGCYLWDMENRRFLDLTAGIAVNSLGHCDPEIAKLIAEQAETLIHASNLYHNPWTGALSKLLVETTVQSGAMRDAAQVFIANSGTEANEAAIKFARKVGKTLDSSGAKHEVVSFHNSFHGRTIGALSATPNPKYQTPFAPMVPGFRYGTYNDIEQLQTLITDKTCGVIVEPIQGEGGVNVATPEFLLALRERCDQVGAVLIYDEIQCGLSRTGTFWAHAHPSLSPPSTSTKPAAHPDILTTAKALGNGVPISATILTRNVASAIATGDHGTTFGGNPLVCRVAHHIVSRLASSELQNGVELKSSLFTTGFHSLKEQFPDVISEIRGLGLILGVQLHANFVPKAAEILTAARQRGLLVITAGEGCLRFVPPLTITEEQIRTSLGILEESFRAVLNN